MRPFGDRFAVKNRDSIFVSVKSLDSEVFGGCQYKGAPIQGAGLSLYTPWVDVPSTQGYKASRPSGASKCTNSTFTNLLRRFFFEEFADSGDAA